MTDSTPPAVRRRTIKEMVVTYPSPVRRSVRVLRVAPPEERAGQRVVGLEWNCRPRADSRLESLDDFGNRLLELRHDVIERQFSFRLSLLTEHWESKIPVEMGVGATGLGAFLLPSRLCNLAPEIATAAREVLRDAASQTEQDRVEALCAWTHQALQYGWGATDRDTSAGDSLLGGQGVCQDYAHLMIALCRSAGIAARYVSGYQDGRGAMHAWVEALFGETWHAWDPTHNRPCDKGTVFVANGRDYRDVAPISGTYDGEGGARLNVQCSCLTE